MAKQDDNPSLLAEARNTISLMTIAAKLLSAPLCAVFARGGTLGERFQGFQMLAGTALMFVIIVFTGGPYAAEQAYYSVGAVCFVLLAHRMHRGRLRRNGFACHSGYTGVFALPGSELFAKGVLAPVLAVVAGVLVIGLLHGLGLYLILAGVSQAVVVGLEGMEMEARVRSIQDARIEQEILMDRYREKEGR